MKNLKTLRVAKKLSQQKLADILHVSQQSIYKYENGITSPDLEPQNYKILIQSLMSEYLSALHS